MPITTSEQDLTLEEVKMRMLLLKIPSREYDNFWLWGVSPPRLKVYKLKPSMNFYQPKIETHLIKAGIDTGLHGFNDKQVTVHFITIKEAVAAFEEELDNY